MPGTTLLVVEDEPVTAEMIQTYFERLSCTVHIAHSADKALELAEEHPPDVLITDLLLKGADSGLTVARELRKRYPDLLIVLTSGLPESDVAAAAAVVPDIRVVAKPVRLSRLRELLGEMLEP